MFLVTLLLIAWVGPVAVNACPKPEKRRTILDIGQLSTLYKIQLVSAKPRKFERASLTTKLATKKGLLITVVGMFMA